MSHMVGTWTLVAADVYPLTETDSHPQITFRDDGIFTGYATGYTFSGRYQASSDWTFTVSDFRANHKFCYDEDDAIRDVLFAGLRSATHFRFEHGTLWIMSGGGKRMTTFIFERMEKDRRPDDTRPVLRNPEALPEAPQPGAEPAALYHPGSDGDSSRQPLR